MEVVRLAVPEVIPVVDEGLGNSSYVVQVDDGEAVVVDPFRDPRPYLRIAASRGWRLRASLETHLHADFVSGSRELAEAAGAEIWVPAAPGAAAGVVEIAREEHTALGGLTLETVPTPGHTPEHVAYVVWDDDRPVAVFSGGTLIVGGVARPDLINEELTEPLARQAYRSITRRLLTLPDATLLYPTHGPGSFCSAGPSDERSSTIGEQRASNPLLQAGDEDTFVQRLLDGLGSYPPYFLELRPVNAGGPRVYGPQPPVPPELSPAAAQRWRAEGAELVDLRPIERFAAGHIPGSLSNALRDQFAVWLGWLVDRRRDVVFVTDADTDVDRAATEARKIGYDRLAGVVPFTAWVSAGEPVATVSLLTPNEAVRAGRQILDVRQDREWAAGHVDGAAHVELGALGHANGQLSADQPVLAQCGHGERAMTAASLLARQGRDVAALAGGPDELAAALDDVDKEA